MSLRRRRPPQWLTFESSKAIGETISIAITRTAGAPAAAWRVIDGGQIYEYSVDALSHVVQVGPCKIECKLNPVFISNITAAEQSITDIKNLNRCVNLINFICYGNTNLQLDLSKFSSLTSLRIVYLGDCPLVTGSIDHLGQLTELREIYFTGCLLLTGSLDSLSNLIHLTYLNLHRCILITGSLDSLSNLILLTYLDLFQCSRINGSIDSLAGMTGLTVIELIDCVLVTGSIDNLAGMTGLVRLSAGSCALLTGNLDSLSACADLVTVILWYCPNITGSGTSFWPHIHQCSLQGQAASQSRINAIVDGIYSNKDTIPSALTLEIAGNNAAPDAARQAKLSELTIAPYNFIVSYNS